MNGVDEVSAQLAASQERVAELEAKLLSAEAAASQRRGTGAYVCVGSWLSGWGGAPRRP